MPKAGFQAERDAATAALRRAEIVASEETGVLIKGCFGYHHLPFRGQDVVVR